MCPESHAAGRRAGAGEACQGKPESLQCFAFHYLDLEESSGRMKLEVLLPTVVTAVLDLFLVMDSDASSALLVCNLCTAQLTSVMYNLMSFDKCAQS